MLSHAIIAALIPLIKNSGQWFTKSILQANSDNHLERNKAAIGIAISVEMEIRIKNSRAIKPMMLVIDAPNTLRIPNSFCLCRTEWEVSPNTSRQARKMEIAENTVKTWLCFFFQCIIHIDFRQEMNRLGHTLNFETAGIVETPWLT